MFDPTGRFLFAAGRRGEGPGEFTGLSRVVRLHGDSIAGFDGTRGTLTVFDNSGKLGRIRRTPVPMGALQLHGVLPDGALLLARAYNPVFTTKTRLERDSVRYLVAPANGEALDTIGSFLGSETFAMSYGDLAMRRDRAFGRVSVAGARGNHLLLGSGDRYEIEVRSIDGRLLELVRLAHSPTRVSRSDIERYKAQQIEEAKTVRYPGAPPEMAATAVARAQRLGDLMVYAETHPAYDSLLVAMTGEVWVRDPAPFRDEPRTWTVFSTTGVAIGLVRTPAGMRLHEIGPDYVLALTRNDDDVEHIGLYRLTWR